MTAGEAIVKMVELPNLNGNLGDAEELVKRIESFSVDIENVKDFISVAEDLASELKSYLFKDVEKIIDILGEVE
jgi:hypothetical protein